jgi:hypothetical protein
VHHNPLRPGVNNQHGRLAPRPVGVVERLGLVRRVSDDPNDLGEGLPRLREVAGPDLELAQAVEQGRRLPLLLGRQFSVARQQRLHRPAFVLAADRTTVARPHFAPRHADLSESQQHLFHQDAGLAVRPLQLRLYVQHRSMRLDRDGVRLLDGRLDSP